MDNVAHSTHEHHFPGVPAQNAHHGIRNAVLRTLIRLLIRIHRGRGRGGARRLSWLGLSLRRFMRVRHNELLGWIEFDPQQVARKLKERFESEARVADHQAVAVAEQKMAVVEHPQIADAVMKSPYGLSIDRTLGQRQHNRANLALLTRRSTTAVPMQQPGDTKGKENFVFSD